MLDVGWLAMLHRSLGCSRGRCLVAWQPSQSKLCVVAAIRQCGDARVVIIWSILARQQLRLRLWLLIQQLLVARRPLSR